MGFGGKLKRARKGLSLSAAAAATGVTAQGLWLIERDDSDPRLATLQAIARGLGVTITVTPRGVTVKEAS